MEHEASQQGRGSEAAECPESACSQLETQQGADFCRLCWGEREEGSAWELLSPCSCSGSLLHIHRQWVPRALRGAAQRCVAQTGCSNTLLPQAAGAAADALARPPALPLVSQRARKAKAPARVL